PPSPDHWSGMIHPLHFAPKAKRVIHLYMAGGPSHLETFDYRPKLRQLNGQAMPDSVTKGQPIAQLQGKELRIMEPQYEFKKYGKSGQEISSLFPHIGEVADDICIIRSMQTDAINHDPAHTFMNTGTSISGRPSMGSWVWYGLGADADNLPGFVVLTSTGKSGQMQPIASRQWHSGVLPSRFQGVLFNSKGEPVHYIQNPKGVSREQQRDVIDAVAQLNQQENELIDDTLVIWGGEFGRTPMAQGNGRDHHIKGFSIWMAGGGIKGGITHGSTDDLGYNAVQDVVHVHDFHATMLHLLGVDHKQLTYRFQGRDFRLTDVAGEVVRPILV